MARYRHVTEENYINGMQDLQARNTTMRQFHRLRQRQL